MNREQKTLVFVVIVLLIVIGSLMGGAIVLWRKSAPPDIPVNVLQQISSRKNAREEMVTTVGLHYFDPQQDSLVRIDKNFPFERGPEQLPELISAVWDNLLESPQAEALVPAIPADSRLLAVFVDTGTQTAYLSVDKGFFVLHPGGTIEGWATAYCLVNTICSISPMIRQVQILRQGEVVEEGPGGWDYSSPISADSTIVRQLNYSAAESPGEFPRQ